MPISFRIFQFIVIHTVKGFGIVNKEEIDVFLELSCFFDDPADVGNLIFCSSAFSFFFSSASSKTSVNIWKFIVHVLLKPGLENFEHYFTSLWDECNCVVVWAFSGIAFLWDSFLLHSKLCLQKLTQCWGTEARFVFKNRDWNISLCPQSYQIGSESLINIYWVHDLHGASHNQLRKQHPKGQALYLEITPQTGVLGRWLFREQSVATSKLKGQRAETESPVGPKDFLCFWLIFPPWGPRSGGGWLWGLSCGFINKSGLMADPRVAYMAASLQLAPLVGLLTGSTAKDSHAEATQNSSLHLCGHTHITCFRFSLKGPTI